MATLRPGKPYIWATWLAKLLGGQECVWSAWFKAHYRYNKYEEMALDLVQWNREHNELMRQRRCELEREGFVCTVEDSNAFKLEGEHAVVAGKPDIIARKDDLVLVVDGKTGRERESDVWQVLLYLFALPKLQPIRGRLEGEVQYKRGDQRLTVTPEELTPDRIDQVVSLIKVISGKAAPPRAPSFHECRQCNIGPGDCPQRVRAERQAAVAAEF
jgi:CRISPR/Cas system-associated exonuclease Cas4 (RecB family)